VEFRTLDVTAGPAVDPVLQEAVAHFGPPDVLLNCAGSARPGYFEGIDAARFSATLALNLQGTWDVVQALLPHMKASGGVIINTASLAGLIGVFGYTDYSAAKFAVIGFSEALRAEVKRYGVRVFVLCPPDTDTPGLLEENREKPPETRAISATASLLTPEAVVEALLKGIEGRRMLIVPGASARFTALAKRLFPGLVEWVMDRAARRA
jgi:3-dehydrosphinganine reductase